MSSCAGRGPWAFATARSRADHRGKLIMWSVASASTAHVLGSHVDHRCPAFATSPRIVSTYYNQTRTHLALQKDAPLRRTVRRRGPIVGHPHLVRTTPSICADVMFGKAKTIICRAIILAKKALGPLAGRRALADPTGVSFNWFHGWGVG